MRWSNFWLCVILASIPIEPQGLFQLPATATSGVEFQTLDAPPDVPSFVVRTLPAGSIAFPVEVTTEMIKTEVPINVRYSVREGTASVPTRFLLYHPNSQLILERAIHLKGGPRTIERFGTWAIVKSPGIYTVAVAPSEKDAAALVKDISLYNRQKLITEMSVMPDKGKRFTTAYKLAQTSTVVCQSVDSQTYKVAWQSPQGERPENQVQKCEWNAESQKAGPYHVQVIATAKTGSEAEGDNETRPVQVEE